jgi:hypothetical protein
MNLCDEKCNECQIINSDNYKQLYTLLQSLNDKYNICSEVNSYCPNMTCCPECHIDDFCHVEGCSISNLN